MMPDQENPEPPKGEPEEAPPMQPTALEDEEYQVVADAWMDAINEKAEAMQEAREDVEVEYSVRSSHFDSRHFFAIPRTDLCIVRRPYPHAPLARHLRHQQTTAQ